MDSWYYTAFGTEFGPITFDELIELAKGEQLSADDMVKLGIDGKLRRAGSIGRLVAHFPFQPAENINLDLVMAGKENVGLAKAPSSGSVRVQGTAANRSAAATKSAALGSPVNGDAVWWCRVDGVEYGPVESATIQEWIAKGRLNEQDELRKKSNGTYALASTYQDFFALAPQNPGSKQKSPIRAVVPISPSGQGPHFASNPTKELTTLDTDPNIPSIAQSPAIDEGVSRSDDELLRVIKDRVAAKNIASFARIAISVQYGIVSLSGNVVSEGERLLLMHLIQQTPGLISIDDHLNVSAKLATAVAQVRPVASKPISSKPKSSSTKLDFSGISSVFGSLKAVQAAIAVAGIVLIGSVVTVLAGSWNGHVAVYPTNGTITLDGKPMPEAAVILNPVVSSDRLKGVSIRGVVDTDGDFKVSTYKDGDGAPAGDYIVTVVWCKRDDSDSEASYGPNLAPAAYADKKTSKLKVTIKKEKNQLKPIQL